jgi:hypothetical protein
MEEVTSGLSIPHLTAVTIGSAYRSVARFAHEHSADLVITGRLDGALSGLEARALLSRVACPVITVPAGSPFVVGTGVPHDSHDTSERWHAEALVR